MKHEAHEGREERIKYKLYPAERKGKGKEIGEIFFYESVMEIVHLFRELFFGRALF